MLAFVFLYLRYKMMEDEPGIEESGISRRHFGSGLLKTAVMAVFLESLFTGCGRNGTASAIPEAPLAVDPKAAPVVKHWAIRLEQLCADLRVESLSPAIWQESIEDLLGRIPLPDLLSFIDFEGLRRRLRFPDLGVSTKRVVFPKLSGLPENTVFHKKVFGMKKGRAIIPHGHSNMASAHLILEGAFHLRHYDKKRDLGTRLLIEPTIDEGVAAGDVSSISDARNNVHWFVAETDRSFTFDVIVLDLNQKRYDIHNIDIDESKPVNGGLLRVPKLDVKTALAKYGKQHH